MGGRREYSYKNIVGKSKAVKEKAKTLEESLDKKAADVAVDTALDMMVVAAPGLNNIAIMLKVAKWSYSVYTKADDTYEATHDKKEVAKTVSKECLKKTVELPVERVLNASMSEQVDRVKKAYNIRTHEHVDQLITHTITNTITEWVFG